MATTVDGWRDDNSLNKLAPVTCITGNALPTMPVVDSQSEAGAESKKTNR
jgi:hypothetical protein